MKSLVSKFAGLLLMSLVLSGSFVAPAQAANTGAYNWTDISSQLSERQNRPVWAIAYAAPYWYATDGQELWSGGHVWRTDGTYVADITTEVRNAGLSRVDDIVSDGKTVIYLKNITRRDRNFEMLAYASGSGYSYPGYQIMQKLDSDEGIVALNGKDGVWSIVTTKGRALLWNVATNTELTRTTISNQYTSQLAYSVKKVSPATSYFMPLTVLPTSNGWLMIVRESSSTTRFYRWTTDGNRVDISNQFPGTAVVHFAASNGKSVLIASASSDQLTTDKLSSFDGYSVTNISAVANEYNSYNFGAIWYGMTATYMQNHWFAVTNKIVYDIDIVNRTATKLSEPKDLFITMASDNDVTALLGGTESTMGSQQSNNPLTAKLVKIQYGYSNNNTGSTGSFGGNRVYTSSNGPTVTTSGNPSNFIVGNGKNFIYRVTATDPQGIDRIDLYVNGARIKTCFSDVCEFDNTYYTNGASSRSVTFMTRVTDRSGWSTESSNEYLTIDQSSNGASSGSTGSGSVTNGTTNLWDWVTPSVTSIKRSETVTYGAGAWNSNGLNRVELWVNGSIRRTCTSSSDMNNCTTVLYGSDYGVGSTLSFNAKAVASNGQETWTSLRSLYVNSDSSTNTGNNNSNGYINTWSNPDVTTLSNGASAVFTVNATDYDGVNRVEILKDGSIVKTCYANYSGNSTITCEYTVASASNGSATFSARLFDVTNNQVTSNSRTYTFTNSNGSNNGGTTNGQTSIWDWIDPNMTSMNRNQSLTYHVGAWNSNGLNRVELWVNGTIRKTCSGNTQDCAFTINGSDYSANANVAFNARAIDGNGTETWTKLRNLYVSDSGTNTGGTTSGATSFYTFLTPGSQWMQFGANIQNPTGLNRVELWVNGTIRKTCSMSELNKIDSQTYQCLIADFGKDYPANTKSSFTARAVYTNGQETWTDVKYSCVIASCADESSNSTGTITVSSNRDIGYYSTSYITITAKGSDADGVAKIEILVNGSLQKTCNNLTTCSTTVGPFGSLKTVSYMARMTDKKGNVVKTAYTIINHR